MRKSPQAPVMGKYIVPWKLRMGGALGLNRRWVDENNIDCVYRR